MFSNVRKNFREVSSSPSLQFLYRFDVLDSAPDLLLDSLLLWQSCLLCKTLDLEFVLLWFVFLIGRYLVRNDFSDNDRRWCYLILYYSISSSEVRSLMRFMFKEERMVNVRNNLFFFFVYIVFLYNKFFYYFFFYKLSIWHLMGWSFPVHCRLHKWL